MFSVLKTQITNTLHPYPDLLILSEKKKKLENFVDQIKRQ